MKVILTEKVPTLGNVGEIVNVSPGYARNYILPNSLGVLADAGHKRELEEQKKRIAKKMTEEKDAAIALKGKIDGLVLEMTKKVGVSGKLFGTVTTTELSKELADKEIAVEKRLLSLEKPIKALGVFDVKAKLFSDVDAIFKVKVVIDPKQAKELEEKEARAVEARAAKKAAAKLAAESGEDTKEEEVPLTEEQRLKAEADKILRSF